MFGFKKRKKGSIGTLVSKIKYEIRCIDYKSAIISGAVVLLGGFISYIAGGSPTYLLHMLKMPSILPTRWFFKLSWTVVYFVIGCTLGNVLSKKERCIQIYKYRGCMFFVIMCIFNYIWYPLFFGAEAIFLSLVSSAIMIIFAFLCMINYIKVDFVSGVIMLLYIFWSAYMFLINFTILIIN